MSTRRILIVEDEMMVEMFLRDMLVDLGHEIVASKRSFNEGLEVAQSAQFDFAILDVNLRGVASYPIADVLRERGIPFAFATGYDKTGIDDRFVDIAVLTKPFSIKLLSSIIDSQA
jgi:DNA-binding response OmpR family regulator